MKSTLDWSKAALPTQEEKNATGEEHQLIVENADEPMGKAGSSQVKDGPVFFLAFLKFCLTAGLVMSAPASAEFSDTPTNRTMRSVEDIAGLPRVLLIGDSISMGYTTPVRELLKGAANVHRIRKTAGPRPVDWSDGTRGWARITGM